MASTTLNPNGEEVLRHTYRATPTMFEAGHTCQRRAGKRLDLLFDMEFNRPCQHCVGSHYDYQCPARKL